MSYQEERLQEIASAIREVKGTTEKIPATNFAREILDLGSVVTPSGIITIKKNGSYNVANYEWAEVSVEADLNERVIVGKWGVADKSFVVEFLLDGTFNLSALGTTVKGTYVISGTQIITTTDNDSVTAQYDNENDTVDFDGIILSRMTDVAGLPIEVTTDTEMTNALVEDNLGKVYKFTGTSDTYETDAIYIVSEVE